MANAITGVTHAAPPAAVKDVQPQAAPQAAPANQKVSQPPPAPKAPAPKDTVQISTAAQTALQESRELSVWGSASPPICIGQNHGLFPLPFEYGPILLKQSVFHLGIN